MTSGPGDDSQEEPLGDSPDDLPGASQGEEAPEEPPTKEAAEPKPAPAKRPSSPPPSDMFPVKSGGAPAEDWLTTYADAITLLMAFFVMMFSISKVDPSRFEGVKKALTSEFGSEAEPVPPSPAEPSPATQAALADMEEPRRVKGAAGELIDFSKDDDRLAGLLSDVRLSERGAVLDFGTTSFFLPGSARLRPRARAALLALSFQLDSLVEAGHTLIVEGHTDPSPPGGGVLNSNWTLSSARAGAVAHFLVEQGLPGERIEARGFADTRPLGKAKVSDRRVSLRVEQHTPVSPPAPASPPPAPAQP